VKKELSYNYRSSSNGEEAFSSAKYALNKAEQENVFPVSVDFIFDEEKKKISGKGKGFEIALEFKDRDLDLFLDLSFLLRPAKKKILSSIENELSKYL